MNGCDCGRYIDGRLVRCARHPLLSRMAPNRPTIAHPMGGPCAYHANSPTLSPFTRRALAAELPPKEFGR